MHLLKDETILTASEDNKVTLTTHRVRYDEGNGSDSTVTSILLEHVSSIQLNSRAYPILFLIGVVLIIAGFVYSANGHNNSTLGVLIIAGIIVCVTYFFYKRHTCIISSDGGSRIEFSTTNMRRENLLEFVDKIEHAQLRRALSISRD